MHSKNLVRTVVAVALLAASASGQVADFWRENLPPLPTPRQEVGVALLDSKIYVIGGILADRSTTGVVERFNLTSGQWEPVPPLPNNVRLHHVGAASAGGKVFAVGGLNSSFQGVRSLYAFDPVANAWDQLADLPTARGAMGVAAIDDRLYAAGGQSGSATFSDFAVYLVDENRWEPLPAMPTARNHLAGVAADGRFFAVSGRSSAGLLNQFEVYDPLLNDWDALAAIPTARAGIAAAVLDDSIFVFGGEGNANDPLGIFHEVESYRISDDRWIRRADMATPRHGIGAVAVENSIHIPGGSPVDGFGVVDVHDAFVPVELLPGDYTADGRVDAADYTVWRDTLGDAGGGLPADGDGDGRITQLDYEFWRMQFGTAASADRAVPEPAFRAIVLSALAVVARRRPKP